MWLPVRIYDSVKSRGWGCRLWGRALPFESRLCTHGQLSRTGLPLPVSTASYPASGQTPHLTQRCGPACGGRIASAGYQWDWPAFHAHCLFSFLLLAVHILCPFFLWICLSSELSHGVVLYIWYLLSVVPLFSFNCFSLHCLFLYYL